VHVCRRCTLLNSIDELRAKRFPEVSLVSHHC
jgi:hypothetical protein